MEAYHTFLNGLVNSNKKEYSGEFALNWVNRYLVEAMQQKRNELCTEVSWLFKKTKPYYKSISQGCQICGEGKWSCLFISNKCNANCFYCPTSQDEDALPSTQNLTFETPEAYAEYINFFNFKGVSFSGGEPFLYFDRTLSYLKALRKVCSPDLYIWIYTNGILVTDEKLKQLSDLGLNEIRFDIGATNYNISSLKTAAKYIEHVTVEVPAVPEERDTLLALLPELIKAGVTHINLHQMRLTKYNFIKFAKRDYTYIPAERPLVLESEICALELMQYAQENKLPIGINYCSFHFKNRFQKAGYRKMILEKLMINNEIITDNGFIRVLNDHDLHYERLILSDFVENALNVTELLIGSKKYQTNRMASSETWQLDTEGLKSVNDQFEDLLAVIPKDERGFKIWQHEQIEEGLREY
ncbi:MAG: radical SAM protein [Salinivirgaceae bacterium]|nr:radical SAM protein [Salinivirgaceae bacterium]